MMKFLLVLLSCAFALGTGINRQPVLPPPACRISTDEINNVQSIPWEDVNRDTLLQSDDSAEDSPSSDLEGLRVELGIPAEEELIRPYRYYHQNMCRTTVTYEPLTSPVTVGGSSVTVLFPGEFQQIKCQFERCPKCPGRCVQKYKYEMALVRDRCRVRWDRVSVPSGCCCHHYLPYFHFV